MAGEKWFEEVSPIMDIDHDCILSKRGDVSVVFGVTLPEIFTMSDDDYESIQVGFVKALKVLPKGTIFHKQDWYLHRSYQAGDEMSDGDFLSKSSSRHFDGRKFLHHESYIILTKKLPTRRSASSMLSSLLRPSIVDGQLLSGDAVREMEAVAGQFKAVLEATGIKLHRLVSAELGSESGKMGYVERYCTLSKDIDSRVLKDIELKPDLRIGDDYCHMFTLADPETLPGLCASRVTYDKYSTDRTKFPIGFASSLGLLLNCEHIYNQYIFIDDSLSALKKLESKRLRLQSLASYSRENAIAKDAVDDFINELISEQRLLVRASFNILVWGNTRDSMREAADQVATGLAQIEAAAKFETVGIAQLWWAGIPGNAAEFPMNETFETFGEQACCFLSVETNYGTTSSDRGIRFCDRISSKPCYVDFYDQPRAEGITSNMGTLVCGASGGGKSVTVNHMLNTLYAQGAHCVVIDIGGSYRGLCELHGGYYFAYERDRPMSFNPFPSLSIGLDTEKRENLKELLVGLWKQENEQFTRAEYVAVSNALEGYYQHLGKDDEIFPCFDSFYEYLSNQYLEVLKEHRVKDRDFDIDNFLYVLRPYYKSGEFGYLLNARENLDLLNERFIYIELDNIKDHPILFPVVVMILVSMFIEKIRKLGAARKVLVIDEAWKSIAKAGMASFIQYAYKTIRKFNGVPCVVSQEIDDLISSPIIKDTIIVNSDVKILMDMRKFVNKFDKIQATFGLSDKAKAILLSVNKDNREIFYDLDGKISKVVRNELSPEEYYAYTTEGRERVRIRELAKLHGGIQQGIEALIREKSNGGRM